MNDELEEARKAQEEIEMRKKTEEQQVRCLFEYEITSKLKAL